MESIGQTLHDARVEKGATLSQAAAATRIKVQHIESMEQDDFSRIAADTYARGFIKIYAEYLGLDVEPLLRLYQQTHAKSVPPTLVEEPTDAADDEKAEAEAKDWLDLQGGHNPLLRVGLLVVGVLVLLLVAAGLLSLVSGGGRGAPLTVGAEARIAEPPDAYLEVALPQGATP